MRDTHLLVKNKRGVDNDVVTWTTKRWAGDVSEDHEHELDIRDVAEISIAPYILGGLR